MNAVIYARVARPEAAELRLERFVIFCRKYAAQHGLTVVGEFQDIHPGTSLNRPGLTAMRQVVAHDVIAAVIVYNLSHLSRSGSSRMSLCLEFARWGTKTHSVLRQKVI
jgi:DNA invertase Pin-like site-specific DNA recombinase